MTKPEIKMKNIIIKVETEKQVQAVIAVLSNAEEENELDFPFNTRIVGSIHNLVTSTDL